MRSSCSSHHHQLSLSNSLNMAPKKQLTKKKPLSIEKRVSAGCFSRLEHNA